MQPNNDKQSISGASFKYLFIGCEITTKPFILAELRSRFKLDYPDNLSRRYPFDFYLEVVAWLRHQLYPGDTETNGYEKIGGNITRGFWRGAAGQVLKSSIAVMGVQRGIPFLFRILTGGVPFGRFEKKEERQGYIRFIWWNVPGPADLTRGIGLEAMETAGVKHCNISYHKLSAIDTEFEINWGE